MNANHAWSGLDRKLVAILRGIGPDDVAEIVAGLIDVGFRAVEIPLNSPEPLRSIEIAIGTAEEASPGECLIDAGTVLSVQDVRQVQAVGGNLIVSATVNPAVIEASVAAGMASLPGVFTATEAHMALTAGASGLKFFPASVSGPEGIGAIRTILPAGTEICAVGGVGPSDFRDYAKAGVQGFGLGSWLYRSSATVSDVVDKARLAIDADLSVAADGAMLAKMRNLGEACTAANRIYVHEAVAETFTEQFTARMAKLKTGDGLEEGIDVGPLVNADTRDKVAAFVDDAVAKGAEIRLGGTRPEGRGFFYPPTVVFNVPDAADCLGDEIFGPVAAIQTFKDESEVIARANDTEYGLVAYVFTEDMKRGLQVCEKLDFGMVGLNRGLVSDPAAPFGGTKQSGLGREGGHEGMLEFMETQYISASW